jgi:hypothetical protein
MHEMFHLSVVDKTFDGIIALKLVDKETEYECIIICAYLPPENSVWGRDAASFYSHILQLCYVHNEADALLLCGDLNSRIGELKDYNEGIDCIPPRNCLDRVKNLHGDAFIEFLKDGKCCVLNGRLNPENDEYTCVSNRGKSVVDYIVVPHDVLDKCYNFEVNSCESILDDIGAQDLIGDRSRCPDHAIVSVYLNMYNDGDELERDNSGCNTQGTELKGESKGKTRRKYNFSATPETFLNSDIARNALISVIDRLSEQALSQSDLDTTYDNLCKAIIREMDDSIPYKDISSKERKFFRNFKPYWNMELTALWKDMVKSRKLYERFNGNKQTLHQMRVEYKMKRTRFDKTLRQMERKYKRGQMLEIETLESNNPNEFWEKVQKLGPRNKTKIPMEIIAENGELKHSVEEVLGKWQNDFSKIYNGPEGENFNMEFYNTKMIEKLMLEDEQNDPLQVPNDHINHEITLGEIINITKKLKKKKAVGVDGIPNEVLKSKETHLLLVHLFNTCFDRGILPNKWRLATVYPIPKNLTDDRRNPMTYRGISLLSTISKTYTGLLNERIQNYLETEQILVDEQNGFRKGRSCIDHIFTTTTIINSRIRQQLPTFTAFIDMKKAFDFVNRELLLYKLLNTNINGKMYNTIKALYTDTCSQVQVNEHFTPWFPTVSGVRQGDNLSPTLFALFLNDLAQALKAQGHGVSLGTEKIPILMYADDIVLLSESEQDLQKQLDYVATWCRNWRLVINSKKSQVVHFRKKGADRTESSFKIDDNTLDVVNSYKYLGIILDEHLSFSNAVDSLGTGGGRALGAINAKFKFLKNMGFRTYDKLFESCVLPILSYGSGVWGLSNFTAIQSVQNRAMRFFLGTHKFTPTLGLCGDMGWYPINIYHKIEMIRLWNRLIKMPDNRLTKRVFKWNLENQAKWSMEVNRVLNMVEMDDCFTSKKICNIQTLSEKLKENYRVDWAQKITEKPKLRLYKTFKQEFKTETYVLSNINRSERSFFAQLRFGILPIHIETGRFTRKPLEERTCKICNNGEVEDEKHFLLNCNTYQYSRDNLIQKCIDKDPAFIHLNDPEKIQYIMTHMANQTAKFVRQAYNVRFHSINN